jgi:hypothetical protein
MSSAALVFWLQIAAIVGCGLTSFALYRTGLYTRYRWFFWYFLFRIFDNIAVICFIQFIGVKSVEYLWLWVLTTPTFWIFYVAVVLELYRLILAKHPGLYTLGRWGMYLGMTLSVAFSLITLLPRISSTLPARSQRTFQILAVDRGVNFGLAVFLLLTVFCLTFLYPVPLSRNLKLHTVLYTLFFLGGSVGSLLHTFFNLKYADSIDTAFSALCSVCTFMWFFLLSPKGEEVHVRQPKLGPEYEARLLQQIESLNSTLMKVSRSEATSTTVR